MKNLLLIVLVLVTSSRILAQNFEGTISWKITTEMDAATKAEMEDAQKKMNDPATQAQMKELRDKMDNDPEFKKMMETNPAMKAQMEAMLKMTEGGNISSMIPTGLTVKIKDQNTWSKMQGGMMANVEYLYLKNKNATYQIDRDAKTYTAMSFQGMDTVKLSDVKITKTGETAKILNYNCTKYIAESTVQGRKMQQFLWTTTEIKGLDMKTLAQQQAGNNHQALFYKQLEGVPLKMEMKQPEMTMIMEVTEIKKQSLPASDFALPAGFTEKK